MGTVRAVGQSGDGGIDGIVDEDPHGLDVIYLQAKRWKACQLSSTTLSSGWIPTTLTRSSG
ncbi:restriction endonuclease [Halomonas korlensis]|uniref:restriction endonuclease n=1 Tax=Halomonas korlensis TaxID=463301 RepID=UPI003CCBF594